uniref:Uncharacterized protein n=1 Tax=Avena sativa TaxID=4498 RepID=A0ACD5ZUN9_AVESA
MFEAQTISNILDQFCQNSCQTPNWSKSGILFTKNVPLSDRENIKRIFPCPNIDSSFVHLGHPLILPSKDRSAAYAFIYDKFKSKLSNYKANLWNVNLINSLFYPTVANSILQTPIIDDTGQDILVWKLTPTGLFSPKSAYKHCFNNLQLPPRERPKTVPPHIVALLN